MKLKELLISVLQKLGIMKKQPLESLELAIKRVQEEIEQLKKEKEDNNDKLDSGYSFFNANLDLVLNNIQTIKQIEEHETKKLKYLKSRESKT